MSVPINDGGRAYPTPAGVQHNDGMTLRDYFAAAALQGICANPRDDYSETTRESKAQESYRQADAMLKAREAK